MNKKRTKKRFVGLDPAVTAVMTNGAVPNRAAMTSKQRRDRQRKRATYDMEPATKAAIEQIARKEGTSASQIAELFLAFAVRAYQKKDMELLRALEVRMPANTPRFQWELQLSGDWRSSLEQCISQAKTPKKWGV